MNTPCINICQIDRKSRLCLGCFRTLEEIGGWSSMTDAGRDTIMADLERRRRDHEAATGETV